MAANNDNNNNEENPQEKNRRLKKEKQCLKQVAAKRKAHQQFDYDDNKTATGAGFSIFLPLPGTFAAGVGFAVPLAPPILLGFAISLPLRISSSWRWLSHSSCPSDLPTFSNPFAAGTASATGLFATLRLGPLTFICLVPFSLDNCHTTLISFSLKQVGCTLLPLKDDYAFQRSVSPLGIYKKWLQ